MFRTEVNIPQSTDKIELKNSIFTIGSCFSDCMGSRLIENKINTLSNPFGTVYNPHSIADLITFALERKFPENDSYVQHQGLWANYYFHSSFSSSDKETIKNNIERIISTAHDHLKKADIILITLGTSFVYKRTDTGSIVANCHKIPQKNFTKELLTQKQILSRLEPLLARLSSEARVILTVSPVRHIKDTIEQNTVSKSTLRLVCDTLAKANEQIAYFPSYEIMMDDLRDYRFYKRDMIHPSEEAEDYIWDKFVGAYFSDDTKSFLAQWAKVKNALAHRPFNPTSEQHQNFIKQNIELLEKLGQQVDITRELALFKKQLI